MELHTLASGSSGNCILLSHCGSHILVDAGISCRRITTALRSLGIEPEELAGVCITHEHSDHIAGLATLTKHYALPLYTSPGTARQLCYRMAGLEDLIRPLAPGEATEVGAFLLGGFSTSHDASEPMGFTFSADGRKAAVVTDLGFVSDEVLRAVVGSQAVVCESNHDVEWLKSGPYPYYLKARILGDKGHLSNEAGAALALRCAQAGAHTVILAHLSAENNSPERALQTALTALSAGGFEDVKLAVAPRSEPSPLYEV